MKQTLLIFPPTPTRLQPDEIYLKTIDFPCGDGELNSCWLGNREYFSSWQSFYRFQPFYVGQRLCRTELFYGIDTDCRYGRYGRNMQKLWCVQHKNIKGLQEGYTWDIIKKYVLLLCEMVKLGEIKDMPKGARMFEGRRELTIYRK